MVSRGCHERPSACIPTLKWAGWREIATEMGLNASHGPEFVRGVAHLHAEQRRHYMLPARVRAGSMPPIHSQLQRLSATLRLAQARCHSEAICTMPCKWS